MSDLADYDADILLWSERQAALLRELKAKSRDLPNELDIENLAEEIESVGRSELSAVESYLELLLTHALKAASVPKPSLVAKSRSEATNFSSHARRRVSPAMLARIDLGDVWESAVRQAALSLAEHEDVLIAGLPERSPLELTCLITRDFDFDAIVSDIRASCAQRPPVG